MAFYKQSISNMKNNEIQIITEVIDIKTCDKCGKEISPMESKDGIIECPYCKNDNSITENNNAIRK